MHPPAKPSTWMFQWNDCILLALAIAWSHCGGVRADESSADRRLIRTAFDLSQDAGQSLGSLFEVRGADGRVLAGAGFLNSYNTQDRSDRRMLHVYARTTRPTPFHLAPLPRPTSEAGTYLYGYRGGLFSFSRSSLDRVLRRWNSEQQMWSIEQSTPALAIEVQGRPMNANGNQILYDKKCVLECPEDQGTIGEWYYNAGVLIVRSFKTDATTTPGALVAFRWNPGDSQLHWKEGKSIPLTHPTEFIYSYGQLGRGANHQIFAASNRGTVLLFRNGSWESVRESDGRSFQVYCALNYRDRLLVGQYPTGQLLELSDGKLELLPDSPPVMPGVSRNAREAQSITIFGGDMIVGVWPWGEVWRRNENGGDWEFLQRVFTHPAPTDQTTHPYEKETMALDPVLNRWGQRVTSLVPMGDSLYISTSAKGHNPFEEKFEFLSDGKHLEYGMVYRYQRSGCLSLPISWTNQRTRVEIQFSKNRIRVLQDGQEMGSSTWEMSDPAVLEDWSLTAGQGVYGPFDGQSLDVQLLP